ncbi:serine hydrolase domain-containing protein [Mangrovicoccus ximenensis]|uniref:serine hydrolase domain-containing protein n=1 Tax=Mangrovicoccus ximenensis TaxID=1911570 RepID=UPI001F3BFA1F|nr:serine hydrolase domain-containing protein [Mangrovicoccus ximenensis]
MSLIESHSETEYAASVPHDVLKLGFDLMWLGVESQAVIAMRLLGLGGLWHIDAGEPGLMVLEKPFGFAEAAGAALAAAHPGARLDQVLSAAVEPLPETLDAAVRAALPLAAAPGIIAAVQSPEGRWSAAYGLADPEAGTAMAEGMHTRIGSITKTFTGTALMQLAEEGKLSLDDPISDYVEGVPNGDRITLRRLADMTSGIASYTQTDEFWNDFASDPQRVYAPGDLLAYAVPVSPIFEPGARFDYSNTNTVLLGMVIEKVTGQPVGEVFRSRIFEPLGLGNTLWPGRSAEMPEPLARGFTLQGNDISPEDPADATFWNPSWGWTAGEMISTLGDLLAYGHALATGQGLLGEEAQTERLASFPEGGGYGIGVGCGGGWLGHTGELPGYNTTLYYHVGSATTVVVQANSDIPSGDCGDADVLPENPGGVVCSGPATRVFTALAQALGAAYVQPSAD